MKYESTGKTVKIGRITYDEIQLRPDVEADRQYLASLHFMLNSLREKGFNPDEIRRMIVDGFDTKKEFYSTAERATFYVQRQQS